MKGNGRLGGAKIAPGKRGKGKVAPWRRQSWVSFGAARRTLALTWGMGLDPSLGPKVHPTKRLRLPQFLHLLTKEMSSQTTTIFPTTGPSLATLRKPLQR